MVGLLYVLTAAATTHFHIAPPDLLFDGITPLAPYQWVHPPPEQAAGNEPPEEGAAALTLGVSGAPPGSVSTGDGQCTVILKGNSVAPRPGESTIRVRILPVDPAGLASASPGLRFDSNAYRIEVVYARSGAPVALRAPMSVVLRAATGGTEIVRLSGGAWTPLQTTGYPLSVLVADVPQVGTFAVLAPEAPRHARVRSWESFALPLAALAAAALALSLRLLLGRRWRRGARG
jgi:hypothetical protein